MGSVLAHWCWKSASSSETCPERSAGRMPLAEKGVGEKGRQPLSPASRPKRAERAALRITPAIAFTVAVIVNGVAVARGKYTNRLGLVAVAALALQFFTGLYLFVLPFATKWRSGQRTD